ncbi:MAG TPA: ABC-type transport auxiliary lipoprotein family protein [Candidatus Eisenbacteria bacterium]|nr:ABC-type transport auxiliary lipoprotein family protein [Candidatus Eisenbacteria bacterium]
MSMRWIGAVCVLLAGCLLPSPPDPPRYFAPTTEDGMPRAATNAPVRLAPVRSPTYLREAMVWRRSEVEYGFYDQRRWTELPSTYVERALARGLFAVERTPGEGTANLPVVYAEVRAFEDVLAPVHEARVAVAIEVVDGRCVLLRTTVAATRPLANDDPGAAARGIGEALDEVAQQADTEIRDAVARRQPCS